MSMSMMMRGLISTGLGLVLTLGTLGASLAAGEPTTPGALSVHATIHSIGIRAPYSGDTNANNTASVRYRPRGTSTWLTGSGMIGDRTAKQWRVSLVHLSPNTVYDIEVVFADPNGVTGAVVAKSIQTRPDYPNVGGGGKIRYVPDQGNLQKVINAAAPGDTIRLRAGVYYTSAILDSGDSGKAGGYVTIEADPGAHVALDGSDPSLNNTSVDNWKLYQGNIYYTQLSWGSRSCGSMVMPSYVGELANGNSVRYLFYSGKTSWNAFLAAPRGKAFYDCNGSNIGRLYIVPYNGGDPDNYQIQVSRHSTGLSLSGADYIRIRNLEFRYYGHYALELGPSAADNNIIEHNTFHGIGKRHIRVGGSQSGFASSNNLIQNNHFFEKGYRDTRWTWDQQKAAAEITAVFLNYTGPGNIIRYNTFLGGHDGINVGRQSSETDVYANNVSECMDDGIQVDEEPGYNIRVWSNKFRYCYVGISAQNWFSGKFWNAGPVYVFRNIIEGGRDPKGRTALNGDAVGYDAGTAFKVGSKQAGIGRLLLYHNTISIQNSRLHSNGIQASGGPYFSHAISRNNLWRVDNKVYNLKHGTSATSHNFDCNNLHNTKPSGGFIQWSNSGGPNGNGIYRDLGTFRSYTGQEKSSLSVTASLLNVDLTLKLGSPEIDAGCLIPGFNDRGPVAYKGAKPDIGAYEFNGSALGSNQSTLELNQTTTPMAPKFEEEVEFQVQLTNSSTTESSVTVTAELPSDLQLQSSSLKASLGTIQEQLQDAKSLISWNGQIEPQGVLEIRFKARVTTQDEKIVQTILLIEDGLGSTINHPISLKLNGQPLYLPFITR